MGITTWPCPKCGQMQRREHANGEAVKSEKCPACKEAKHDNNDDSDDGA